MTPVYISPLTLITFAEDSRVIDSAKLRKSYLDIPNEVMKNEVNGE